MGLSLKHSNFIRDRNLRRVDSVNSQRWCLCLCVLVWEWIVESLNQNSKDSYNEISSLFIMIMAVDYSLWYPRGSLKSLHTPEVVKDVQIGSTISHLLLLLVLCCSKLDMINRDSLGRSTMKIYLAGISHLVLPCAPTDGEIYPPQKTINSGGAMVANWCGSWGVWGSDFTLCLSQWPFRMVKITTSCNMHRFMPMKCIKSTNHF